MASNIKGSSDLSRKTSAIWSPDFVDCHVLVNLISYRIYMCFIVKMTPNSLNTFIWNCQCGGEQGNLMIRHVVDNFPHHEICSPEAEFIKKIDPCTSRHS